MATSGSNGYELNWTLGGNTVLTLAEIGDELQINGYKENDFVITKSESGNLVLTDAKHGTITISNWPSDNAPSIGFSATDYTKVLTGERINAQLFNVVTLSDDQSYSGGTDTHQEFDIAFSEATNITIDSSSSTEDRIKFTNNWSADNVDLQIIGNDFYIKNWDSSTSQVDGQVVIKNYMNSSVKTIEFGNLTYHLITGSADFVGSDTIRDRYLFLDSVKNGSDPVSGDWNVTIDGAGSGSGDILDFRFLPNNMHYYGLYSQRDGKDMVLSYQYSPTPDSNLETLGTIRLKNYFNEDGSVNTDNGTFRIRTNREFYTGEFSSNAFDRLVWEAIKGSSEDKNDRWLYLSTGTAASDEVDLADLVKPIDGYGWLYYAGDGDDTVTARKGDIVYGDAGDDTLYAKGRNSDIHGGAGNDTITVRGENGENISRVVVRGEGGNDIINAYGSYHAVFGNKGEDEIHLRDNAGDSDLSHNSYAGGGSDNDKLYIHAGHDHRIVGGGGNDILYAYLGDNHVLNGGAGEDEIHIVDDGTQRSNHNTAFGGADNDYLYIENGGQNHYLFGDGGDDYLSVDGDNNVLDGGIGNDTIIAIKGNNNILDGGPGNDILTGGAGNDIFVHTNGNGNDTVENYTAGSDIIQINDGSISKTELVNSGKDVKFTVGTGSVTVANGAGKTISLKDSRGSYTVSGEEILLGTGFTGTMDASEYLGTVSLVKGRMTTGNLVLKGNGSKNTLMGGYGNDTLYGYGGDDTLYGCEGTDTLYGGAGKDTFVHYQGYGNDTVMDYTAGEDIIELANGSISKTELLNSGKDVKFTIGSGSVTVKDGANKTISLKDSRGSYTVSGSEILLGSGFTGTMDAGVYLDTVSLVKGRSATGNLTLKGTGSKNTLMGGYGNDTLYGYGGDDTLYGCEGTDTLYGGAGKDTFVHYQSYGNDTVMDYTAGEDIIELANGSISKTELLNSGKDVKFTIGSGSVTVKDGANKTISLKDSRGSYTVSGSEILLGSGFTGTMDAGVYLDTVSLVKGRSATGNLTLKGTGSKNTLMGGYGNDTLYGYGGDDTLYGCEGTDTLYGGAGKDTFVHYQGYGNDTVMDYTAGEDIIELANGSISKTELLNSGKDVKFTIGSGSVTVKDGANKTISLKDSRGSYTVSGSEILLGSGFTGTMDAGVYLDTVSLVKGRSATGNLTLKGTGSKNTLMGGYGNDTLYGYGGDDTLYGCEGTDTLYGGAGKDTFVHYQGYGNDTVMDYTAGEDIIELANGSISKTELLNSGKDVKFTIGSGSVTVKDGANKTISLKDSRGSYTVSGSEILLGSGFTGTMDAGVYLDTVSLVKGRSATGNLTLKGTGSKNTLMGGYGNDTLYGYGGDDTLYGCEGTDTLYGGAGKDTFVHYQGYGNDTVMDYTAGEDIIELANGSISKTELLNSGKDVKFTIGSGSVTVKDGANKTISLKDSRGSYTVSGSEILLGSGFTGTMDAGVYLDTVSLVKGRSATGNLTLKGTGSKNTLMGGYGNDTLYGYGGDDTLYGCEGTDTLYGGAGKDTFVHYQGYGNDTVMDYTAGEDIIELANGSISKTELLNSGKDVKFTIGSGSVTVKDGANKTISLKDSRGSYTVSGSEILLGSGFTGTMDAGVYLDTVSLVKGRSATGNLTLKGTGSKNTLMGGYGNDTLYGYGGDDTLYGCEGTDTLYGGAGKDTFVHYQSYGNDTVMDYTAGEDIIELANGSISKTELLNSGKDVKFTIGSGSVTVKDGANKTISLKDSCGSYTVSGSEILLGSGFTGTMDAGVYLDTVSLVKGRSATGNLTLKGTGSKNTLMGGYGNDTLYGYGGDDTLYGCEGTDTLYGGAGKDTFVHYQGYGNDTVMDYTAGEDIIELANGSISKTELLNSGKDVKFTIGSGSVTVKDGANKTISLKDSRGSYTVSGSEILLGSGFTGTMDAGVYLDTVTTIDGRSTAKGVTITGNGNVNTIYGGSGVDVLNGGAEDIYLNGGTGDDTYAIANIASNTNITIDQSTGSASDADVLQLTSVNSSDVNYSLQDGVLTITHDNGGKINISGWEENLLSKIVFANNTELTGAEVTALASIVTVTNKSDTYAASGEGTVFRFIGTGYNATLTGTSSLDTLDFSRYNDGEYDIGDYRREGDDLYVTFIEYGEGEGFEDGERLIGSFRVKDYFASESKIEDFTYYNSAKDSVLNLKLKVNENGGDDDDFILGISENESQSETGTGTVNVTGVTLRAGAGNDIVYGTRFDDKLYGDAGNDTLEGGDGDDYLYGGAGNDTLNGGDGSDCLYGQDGDDHLSAEGENNHLYGGAGNDTLEAIGGGAVYNYLSGDAGNDNYIVKWMLPKEDYYYGVNINNRTAADKDKDNLVIRGVNSSDFEFYISTANNEDLYIQDRASGHNRDYIVISDWANHRLESVTFDDKTLTNDEIYRIVANKDHEFYMRQSASYEAGQWKDVFSYRGTDINTTITGFIAGEDSIDMRGNSITQTELVNDGTDVKFTVGSGSVTVQNVSDETISMKDSRGSYTASKTTITLGSDFAGDMDANAYLSTVITIDGRPAVKKVTIHGNGNDNIIYAGDGDDNLYGGEGKDTFWFESGKHTIHDFEIGKDTIRLASADVTKSEVLGNDAVLTLSNGGKIKVKNMAGQTMNYFDSAGASKFIGFGTETAETITQQSVIKKFMMSLDESTTIVENAKGALNTAISYASNGVFATWDGLIGKFIGDINNYGATTYDKSKEFLNTYCGIDLDNLDTGAITGADAKPTVVGAEVKTADSIVPESGTIDPVGEATTSTINGLTLYWERTDEEMESRMSDEAEVPTWWYNGGGNVDQQTAIADRLNTWWTKESLNLIEDSYGLSFMGATVKDIDVRFSEFDSNTLARVRNRFYTSGSNIGESTELRLQINMNHFNSIDFSNVDNMNGDSGTQGTFYLDRVLAHEFTHAVMAANITGFSYLPSCLKEGAAELVHGIDDIRTTMIKKLGLVSNSETLSNVLSDMNVYDEVSEVYYAGGYMLLRYFAKQSAENYGSVLESTSSNMVATSNSNSIVSDPIVSAASMLWTDEQPAAVADTGSELASSMASINNALLTPLDSTDSNVLGSDSLASDLFSDTNNKGLNFLG